jgi:UDP-N-acetylglucosamine 2-epimerase (non-hydrolysing)
MKKIALVVGTRPEGIKMAPIVRALREHANHCEALLVSTGQHRDMLGQVLRLFGMAPDVDLRVMKPGQDLFDVTAASLIGMRSVLREHRPDHVVVQGDTTTAFAAALAAFYEKIPVSHVEAGLRSGNRHLPFPEEINRKLIDQVSDWMFAPTDSAREALLAEGFDPERVEVTGNTVVDALLHARSIARERVPSIPGLDERSIAGKRILLVTGHRRESFGPTFEGICHALLRIARNHRDVAIVYPVHLNPNVEEPVRRVLGGQEGIHLLAPLGYLEFVALMDRSHLILTDSGGIQEEAPSLGKPLLVMRDVTERPEGIDAGVARLLGTAEESIVRGVEELLEDSAVYERMASGGNPYGDGKAAARIADRLLG